MTSSTPPRRPTQPSMPRKPSTPSMPVRRPTPTPGPSSVGGRTPSRPSWPAAGGAKTGSSPPPPSRTTLSGRGQRGSDPPSRATLGGRRPSLHALRQGGGTGDEAERAERRRQATIQVVTAFFRLVKACQLYDDANQTVQQAVPGASDAIEAFCAAFDADNVRLLFSPEMVFVNRRILRAPRESYALALQLGALLEAAGINELTLERRIGATTLLRVARILVDAQRSPTATSELCGDGLAGAIGRRAALPDDWATERRESPVAKVLKGYAAAVLVLKAFRSRFLAGDARGASEVKRVAQKLVAIGESYPELLVAAAATPLPDDDPVRAATSSAVLALAMARKLTADRSVLTAIAHATLLAEVGELRLGDPTASPRFAPSALIVLARLGQFHEGTLRRAVVTYEALSEATDAGSTEGAGDGDGSPTLAGPTVAAILVRTARQFNSLRTPRQGTRPLGIDDALRQLDAMAEGPLDVAAVRLLTAGLGFFPEGTLVELTSGEVAMVTGTPAVALDFARPPVRVLTDEQHRVLGQPIELDLARPGKGQRPRSIQRAVLDRSMPT